MQKVWDLKSSKYGQFLKHCHFKYKQRKEFEENFTDVRRENILLSKPNKMKYLIIGLNFLVENPQSPPGKYHPPLVAQPSAQKNKQVPAPPFLRMLQNF